MTTALCSPVLLRPVAQYDPLWDALYNLGWSEVPTDLTEIDASWCYFALSELGQDEIDDLLQLAPWDVMNGFAYDLRDAWHTARCEAMEFDREVRDHRDYI
jgi:hypothetical protein